AADDSIWLLIKLQEKLEECRYEEFWQLRSSSEYNEVFADIEGFDDAIRNVIAQSLSLSFQSLPKEIAARYLNLK
ncbi:hypothetical protein L0F63_007296, partial [Massospora cicadina]